MATEERKHIDGEQRRNGWPSSESWDYDSDL